MWLPIRGTSDMTEAIHFSQCVHDQQRRLEAEDCDSIRCAQLISGGRRRIRPPCSVPRSRSPTMRLVGASASEPHTYGVAGAEMRNIVRQRGPGGPNSSRAAAPAGQYHTRCARVAAPARAPPAGQPWWMWGERHGSQYALPVVIDCHPILWRRWRPG